MANFVVVVVDEGVHLFRGRPDPTRVVSVGVEVRNTVDCVDRMEKWAWIRGVVVADSTDEYRPRKDEDSDKGVLAAVLDENAHTVSTWIQRLPNNTHNHHMPIAWGWWWCLVERVLLVGVWCFMVITGELVRRSDKSNVSLS